MSEKPTWICECGTVNEITSVPFLRPGEEITENCDGCGCDTIISYDGNSFDLDYQGQEIDTGSSVVEQFKQLLP